MKNIYSSALMLTVFLISYFLPTDAYAQDNCGFTFSHGQGYTTTISSVVLNSDGTHTITLIVENNGCLGCKKLNRYSVQAAPGTYSNISVQLLSGNFTYANIGFGPNLSGDPFQGFRINNTNGMGNGQQAAFALTYTLTGGLQNQQILVKTSSNNLLGSLSIANFQAVLDCQNVQEPSQILPYYTPLAAGKSYDLIGSELTSLYNSYAETGNYISDDIFQIVGSSVLISVLTQPGQFENTLSLLTSPAYGLTIPSGNAANNLFTGLIPIINLLSLNELPELIISASPVYPALGNAGIVTSQGDVSMRSDLARTGFQVNGQGIKVGVLSDSYNTKLGNPAADDVIKGDLPGVDNPDNTSPVDVLLDYPFGTRSDEGRAMLQIIHDVAPGADLAFRTGFLGVTDFAAGIEQLAAAGCDIIVDDITYINEPFFRDGVVAQAVETVTAQGVSYFSAAGNFGTKSWQNAFNPSPAPAGITGEAHNFAAGSGTTDIYQSITLYQGNYTVVFQWDDGTPGNITNSDYDIYLANENGNTLFGFNRVNTGGAPIEVLPFTVAADSAQSNFLIIRESGSGPAELKYIIFRGDIVVNEYATPGASTITGQANAASTFSVGAVLYSNTPAFGVNPPTVASFSSRGGTPVNGEFRFKPDFTAPNGVNTTVDLGGVNIDGDEFPNFFGTSAAAPHAAAVGALVLDARQKYYGNTLSPSLLKGVLQSTAIDMYTPGYDPASGAGFIQADAALQTLANPSPFISEIFYDQTLTPGLDSIWITIYGQYLTTGSEIWFNGAPLASTTILQGDTAIISVIPPFDDLYPEIQVYNPPLEGTNGLDGGLSNPLYFTTKETILITIDNKSKKYGEVLPAFTASYTLESPDESIELNNSDLTQIELDRIYAIGITTIANSLSNVGLWAIVPNPADPLSPGNNTSATDSLDISLLQRYSFIYNTGLLTIDPLDLLIAPRDTFFVYNDSLAGLSFDYLFSGATIGISESDSLAIVSALKTIHGTALVNAVAVVRGTALVNDAGEPVINAAELLNKSFMISQALFQTRGTALVNGELIDPGAFANALAPANTSTSVQVRGTALVNAFQLVRGTALVNQLDSSGNIVNTTPLANADVLVNSSAQMNATSINADSNTETIVILGEGDIAILSGDSVGNVVIRSVSLITDNTVGTHFSLAGALLTNNFNVNYGLGTVTVLPDTAQIVIDPASLIQAYDGSPKQIVVAAQPDTIALVVTYNGSTQPPVDAGTYAVEVLVNDPNYVGSASATMVINPVNATVSTGIYVIDKNQPLPAFTATFEGLLAGDSPSVVSSLTFIVNPAYSGAPGTYQVIPVAVAPNYSFTSVNGTLYVNPAGPGTKQVKPIFLCYEDLPQPNANGYTRLASFSYVNANPASVYIPIGPDNIIFGAANDNSNQPVLFLPSGGTFTVPYAGGSITWQVTSNRNNNSKGAIPANSSNTLCNKSASGAENNELTGSDANKIQLFPNPSTGRVFIQLNGEQISTGNIEVFDNYGKRCQFSTVKSSKDVFELDLSHLETGLYIIRISGSGWVQVSKLIIQ